MLDKPMCNVHIFGIDAFCGAQKTHNVHLSHSISCRKSSTAGIYFLQLQYFHRFCTSWPGRKPFYMAKNRTVVQWETVWSSDMAFSWYADGRQI